MSILSLFHKVGAAYKNDRSKKMAAHVLLIGGIAKRKQSWARRVRIVDCSYLDINSLFIHINTQGLHHEMPCESKSRL